MLKLLAGQVFGAVGAIHLAFAIHVEDAFGVVALRCTHFRAVSD